MFYAFNYYFVLNKLSFALGLWLTKPNGALYSPGIKCTLLFPTSKYIEDKIMNILDTTVEKGWQLACFIHF